VNRNGIALESHYTQPLIYLPPITGNSFIEIVGLEF